MPKDCVDGRTFGYTYAGSVNHTVSGIPCQRWDSQSPHDHSQGADNFPEKNLTLAENYCRNPDAEATVWCYTVDSNDRWQFCDVPDCSMFYHNSCFETDHFAYVVDRVILVLT